jgi:hypothetical protein
MSCTWVSKWLVEGREEEEDYECWDVLQNKKPTRIFTKSLKLVRKSDIFSI